MIEAQDQYATGCFMTPPPIGMASINTVQLVGAVEIPDQFIVPYYRDLFDADFKRLSTVPAGKPIKNQRGIPSCVGESVAYLKAASEGYEISGRDGYRQGKRRDGMGDVMSWGTSIWAVLDALFDTGIASELMVPDTSDQPLATYVSIADVTPAVEYDREKHRSRRPFFMNRNEILATLWAQRIPVVTSCMWYTADNYMPDGMMKASSGNAVGGHAFAIIGVVRRLGMRCLVALNSWTDKWGDYGVFYIPLDGPAFMRLGDGYTALDIEPNLAEVLVRYNGRIVKTKTSPKVWKIEGGKRRWIPDERVFFPLGYMFGEELDITERDLELIPVGNNMSNADANPREVERFRQIAAFYGH